MSRFTDFDELREEAEKRLARRRGEVSGAEKRAARERLQARSARSASSASSAQVTTYRQPFFKRPSMLFGGVALCVLIALGIGILSHLNATAQPAADTMGTEGTSQGEHVDLGNSEGQSLEIILPNYLDPDLTSRLQSSAQGDSTLAHIANQADAYGRFGATNQKNLLTLALNEPLAVPFVDKLPDSYPNNDNPLYTESLPTKGLVPRLYQWDTRWAFKEYSSAPFGLTGCCPTSLSMVYMALTGKTDRTPGTLADLARDNGYMSEENGTVGSFLIYEAPNLGLVCFESLLSSYTLKSGLEEGYLYICNVGRGDFTEDGHFFVITGMSGSDAVTINDPYSSARSDQVWNIDQVLNQTITLYAFKAA